MNNQRSALRLFGLLALLFALVAPISAKSATSGFQTDFDSWHAADNAFANWERSGVSLADGSLVLDPATAQPGSDPYAPGGYYGGNYYNGGSFIVGEAVSPPVLASFGYKQAIASWNAATPSGTWVETQIRARFGTRWSKWYNLGIWASGSETVQRHSVRLQGDTDGYVAVDTLVLSNKKETSNAYQLKVRLFSADGSAVSSLRSLSVALSTAAEKGTQLVPGDPARWGTLLNVPECSQMVYPDGGEVWCSPTSTSMVLGYWSGDTGPCEPRVRAAVEGVYDWIYDGHGNWPFNTAYAASQGLEGYVARFTSFAQVEPWIEAGVPVIISFAWGKGELTGAAIPSSSGHLAVVVGFDANGNPVVNDPAASSDQDVQRTYVRSELESLWLEHSAGTVYLIYPAGHPVPQL